MASTTYTTKEKWDRRSEKIIVFSYDNLLLMKLKGITNLLQGSKWKGYKDRKILATLDKKERKKSNTAVRLYDSNIVKAAE